VLDLAAPRRARSRAENKDIKPTGCLVKGEEMAPRLELDELGVPGACFAVVRWPSSAL